jgi:tricorn protease
MSDSWIRTPAVRGDRVVFVADDDVFEGPLGGGTARRLTSGPGLPLRPQWSPDGATLTWDSTAEGARDVWAGDADGGRVRRLTWGGATSLGFDPRGRAVVSSAAGAPFARETTARVLDGRGGGSVAPFGPLAGIAASPTGRVLVVRNATELSTWRGYRGGRMGVAWLGIPRTGDPTDWVGATFGWQKLVLPFAVAAPTWGRGRFWFVGDPGPAPELCSVDESGGDLQVHTALGGFGVRHPSSDGHQLVFVHDGRLMRLGGDTPTEVAFELGAHRADRRPRPFVATRHVEDLDLHPDGHSVAVVARGRVWSMGHWEGPARRWAGGDGARRTFARWVDADRLLTVSDAGDAWRFELLGPGRAARTYAAEHGRPVTVEVDPTGRRVAFVDHTHTLRVLDLERGDLTVLESAPPGGVELDWSPDGQWLAWSRWTTTSRGGLRLRSMADDAVTVDVTDGSFLDSSPSFDPDGNHLYFLSLRDLDPIRDTVSFGYGFHRGIRPYCLPLRRDVPHPFRPGPRPLKAPPSPKTSGERPPVVVDLEGLDTRVVAFPVPEGRWSRIVGLPGGCVALVREPLKGMLDRNVFADAPPESEGSLHLWEADKQELTDVTTRVGDLRVDRRRETLVWRSAWRVRVGLARPDKGAREELKKLDGRAERKTGWLDLGRLRDEIDPVPEWRQMVFEAHRLMRDHFWREPDEALLAAAVEARDRVLALLPRVATRHDLSELLGNMLGVWGTSHSYEVGGDTPSVPTRRLGALGADVSWDDTLRGWRLDRVLVGDPGTERTSPLLAPGACAVAGEVITAVDGRPADPAVPLEALLVDRASTPVALDLAHPEDGVPRTVTVVPTTSERELRYRDWVHGRRALTRERSGGRVGYLHVPNMGPSGYAEFYRDWPLAVRHDALLVDVRHNGGGHVSQLLLRLLLQRRLGSKFPRHGPELPYPLDAPPAGLALLTNETAGSDGDIFTHAWKASGLGPVFGTRTWGGVVGIVPRLRLVDRTLTTQPEFATWFDGVGYGIENRGVEPDVVVELAPDVAASGEDPALDAAVAHLLARLPA